MKRPGVVAVLLFAQLLGGCALSPAPVPPAANPDALAEVIARRGQGELPPADDAPQPQGSGVVADCLEATALVGKYTLGISLMMLYMIAGGRPSSTLPEMMRN